MAKAKEASSESLFVCVPLPGHPALFYGSAGNDIIRIEIASPMKENRTEGSEDSQGDGPFGVRSVSAG